MPAKVALMKRRIHVRLRYAEAPLQETPMQKVTEKFLLRSANRSHEAVMLQKQIETTTPGDEGRQYVDGAKEYRLADGRHLTCIDEHTFEVATTGERLTRS